MNTIHTHKEKKIKCVVIKKCLYFLYFNLLFLRGVPVVNKHEKLFKAYPIKIDRQTKRDTDTQLK